MLLLLLLLLTALLLRTPFIPPTFDSPTFKFPLEFIPRPRFCIAKDGDKGERGDKGEWCGERGECRGAFWGELGPLPPIDVWIVRGELGRRCDGVVLSLERVLNIMFW